jgi:asparagine synthase (glutamine-hydrolysing)
MCGIAGLISFDGRPASLEALHAMCAATAHRGPDDFGYYSDDHAALGMRRLSIIDRATGHQPVHNEDGTVWVVSNGEIYNYRQLTKELKQSGHTFYTESDTEVIVHLYEEYGLEGVGKLRGMFAFASASSPSTTVRSAAGSSSHRSSRHCFSYRRSSAGSTGRRSVTCSPGCPHPPRRASSRGYTSWSRPTC